MIKNIIILLIFIAAVLLVIFYYKPSALTLGNGVTLKVNGKTVTFNMASRTPTPIVFSNVQIEQTLLEQNASKSFFEVATTESLYEFNQHTENLVSILFDVKELNTIFSIKGVRAIQLVSKDSTVVNLFIDDNDGTSLKLFYGISTEEFSKTIITVLGKNEHTLKEALALTKPVTQWNAQHNDFDGIISTIDH